MVQQDFVRPHDQRADRGGREDIVGPSWWAMDQTPARLLLEKAEALVDGALLLEGM